MKKICLILLITVLLTGCRGKGAMETVSDVPYTPVIANLKRIQLQLPPELSTPVLENEDSGSLYICDTYSVTVQTAPSGDLKKTIQDATGIDQGKLDVLQTRRGDAKCYQWVWTANSETGTQIGRACVLDDGAYHYILTAVADENNGREVQHKWREIFASFSLATEKEPVSTGS